MAPEEAAARLLMTASALDDLTLADAHKVVTYMRPKRIAPGTVFIQEGEIKHNDYMLLVLEGNSAVQSELSGLHDAMMVSVMGPGNLIGEMGVLDQSERQASAFMPVLSDQADTACCCWPSPSAWTIACARRTASCEPLLR